MANSKENTHVRIIPLEQEIDLRHIIHQAHVRWLRPPEIWEILRNYQKYDLKLSPVPPSKPPSGALFLFDRNVLRYFRKDGHNWRKKKDGKTVREAHERLKVGSVDVLHCYYAHGEDNPNFQRRSYWMLEGAYEHIVLVHYLEVTQSTRLGMYRMWNSAAEGALPAANHEEQSTSTVETFTPSLFPHALASSPGNSEPEVTGPSSFDPVDIANASYSSLLEEESGEDMQNKYVAGFIASIKQSSLLEQLSGRARIKDSATGLQRPAFVSSPEPGYGKEPNCELQPMKDFSGEKEQVSLSCPIQLSELKIDECNQKTAAYDIMQNLDNVDFLYPQRNPDLYLGPQLFSVSATSKNVKIDRDASENQGTGGTAQVDAMEHFVKKECCSPSWAELLEMCNRNASVDSLLNPNERVPQGSAAIESILQVPSSNRPPGTVLEAQLQAVTAENAIKAAAEARHQRGVSHMPLQSTHSSVPYAAQQVYAKQLLSTSQGGSSSRLADMQHHFESLDNRSELHQGQQQHRQQEQRENEIRNEASEWYDKKLWQQEELQNEANKFGLLGRDMQVVHAPSSTVRMQSNNEKVLLSEKQYPHLNKEDSLGRWWSEAISEDNESTPLTGPSDSGSEWVTTLDEEVSTKANSRGALQLQMDMGLNVSISRVQKFSIFEFSPDWGFAFEESKVSLSLSLSLSLTHTHTHTHTHIKCIHKNLYSVIATSEQRPFIF
ncbi:hypothetical protein O6H91_19G025600 [Diphasiastrum complanatum]|uniref:Uncharacterized protein n=1 Tax=Diphasiastrum complanatum TaxID=34168 RepID=A0ACC2ATN8_DIPCM|nr:hypothetical protein O6H91_19G025600 [Diphasiastrum complanatum]